MDSKVELKKLIRELSYREGNFTLSSGQKSSYYVNLKPTALHPEGAHLIGKLMVERLLSEVKTGSLKVDAVGGLTLGADPIATSVSLAAREKATHWPAFIVRKEAKGHGTEQYIEGAENLQAGASVAVLEDVSTTGASSLKAVERLRAAGFTPTCVFTVVDREMGAVDLYAKEGLPFYWLFKLSEIQAG